MFVGGTNIEEMNKKRKWEGEAATGRFKRLRSVEPEMLKPEVRKPREEEVKEKAEEKKEKEKKKEGRRKRWLRPAASQLLPMAQVALVHSNRRRKQHATVLKNTRE